MNFDSFISDLLATIAGGIAIATVFFLIKERIFPPPSIDGRWIAQTTTRESAYNPYQGMVLRYQVFIWREGLAIRGTAEKISESSTNGDRDFVGPNRTRSEVNGYIEKNYFGKDLITVHFVESGHGRESSHLHSLTRTSAKRLVGTFQSMVANQSGVTEWRRVGS